MNIEKRRQDIIHYLMKNGIVSVNHLIEIMKESPATIRRDLTFLEENGYENDFSGDRLHHEIYLSDPRKTEASRRKTVIRHPVKMGAEETPRVHIERQEDVRR